MLKGISWLTILALIFLIGLAAQNDLRANANSFVPRSILRWIDASYAKGSKQSKAARQLASAFQGILANTDPKAVTMEISRAIDCMAENKMDYMNAKNEIRRRVFDTPKKVEAYIRYQEAMNGSSIALGAPGQEPACKD